MPLQFKQHAKCKALSLFLALFFIFVFITPPQSEAARAYQHVCQKCGTSITNKSPHGPANKKCRKGGTHSWKHIAIK